MIPPKVGIKQKQWQLDLLTKCDGKTRELLLIIPVFIEEQLAGKELHRNSNYYLPATINNNVLPITKEWIHKYDMFNSISDDQHKVRYFNKAIKNLCKADVIAKEDENYILNPLYYCASSKHYLDSYIKWCKATNTKPNNIYLEGSIYEYHGTHKHLDDVDAKEINVFIQNNIFVYQ